MDYRARTETGFRHGAACKTSQRSLRQEDLPPEKELAGCRTHVATNMRACQSTTVTVLADLVCNVITTIVVVLLHNDVRDAELAVTVLLRQLNSREK